MRPAADDYRTLPLSLYLLGGIAGSRENKISDSWEIQYHNQEQSLEI